MSNDRTHVNSLPMRSIAIKAVPGLIASIVVGFAIFAAKWQIGEMLSELSSPTQEEAVRTAEAAISMVPRDPKAHWLMGASLRNDFSSPGLTASNENFRQSVRLAPYSYRWWSELGRSYEQIGQDDNAETSLLMAVSLAPEYTLPNWQLGNFYLRRGNVEKAIGPLRIAARYSPIYRGQVYAIAWSYFGGDTAMVERFASDEDGSLATLVSFYAGVGKAQDALRIWNRLTDEGKNANRTTAFAAARTLFERGSLSVALEFARQSGLDKNARPGAFTNGDFEAGIKEPDSFLFDWAVSRTDSKLDIGSDSSVAHGGKRSLRTLFRGYVKQTFSDIQQTIAVRPGSLQRIEFWVRTENLRSGSMPLFLLVGGKGQQVLGVSPPFPSGTNEWQRMSVVVDVPPDSEGIRIVSSREPCPAECPLSGIFWIDDFQITELSS